MLLSIPTDKLGDKEKNVYIKGYINIFLIPVNANLLAGLWAWTKFKRNQSCFRVFYVLRIFLSWTFPTSNTFGALDLLLRRQNFVVTLPHLLIFPSIYEVILPLFSKIDWKFNGELAFEKGKPVFFFIELRIVSVVTSHLRPVSDDTLSSSLSVTVVTGLAAKLAKKLSQVAGANFILF